MEYTQIHDMDGKFIGVRRMSDGASIPQDPRNRDWRKFEIWNARQQQPLDLSDIIIQRRRPREIVALVQAIADLSAADRVKVLNVCAAAVLRQHPAIARAVGVAIDGDEIDA